MKTLDEGSLNGEFNIRVRSVSNLTLFQNTEEERICCNSLHDSSLTLILKLTKILQKKVKLWTNIPYQYRHRNPKQDISK